MSKYDEFYDAVKYLYERDIMNGTSDTLFSPNAELTRGMVVTILYRMEGEPLHDGCKDVQRRCGRPLLQQGCGMGS